MRRSWTLGAAAFCGVVLAFTVPRVGDGSPVEAPLSSADDPSIVEEPCPADFVRVTGIEQTDRALHTLDNDWVGRWEPGQIWHVGDQKHAVPWWTLLETEGCAETPFCAQSSALESAASGQGIQPDQLHCLASSEHRGGGPGRPAEQLDR